MPAMPPTRMSLATARLPARFSERGAFLCIAGLLLTVPFLVVPTAVEGFRAPKLALADLWALASLAFLAAGLWRAQRVDGREAWSPLALRAVGPLVVLAVISCFTTAHPLYVRRATVELAIGALCLVAWSIGLHRSTRERLLAWLAWPASALALLAMLQVTGVYRPFLLAGGEESSRMGIVSLAGNTGDLATYLVLPCLLLQASIGGAQGRRKAFRIGALVLCVLGIAVSQTFTALLALGLGSLLLWLQRLPRRRALRAIGVGLLVLGVAVAAVPPLRHRAINKVNLVRGGDWAQFFTYRLDGWRAATWMLAEHPLSGVGHGAYRSNYSAARLALVAAGRDYAGEYRQLTFVNAHNDFLEVAAELGWPGLAALGVALWTLVVALRAQCEPDRSLSLAAVASLAVLAFAGFPFEVALIAYPWVLFLSGVLAPAEAPDAEPARAAQPKRRRR